MERTASGLKLQLGERAPYFSLKGTDSKIYSLADFQGASALVVLFTCNHCPYAQAYESRIVEMALAGREKGVKFVAICSNDPIGYPQDDFESMVEKSKQLGFPFPYLCDDQQITAKAYDAQCTPEAYLFDAELKLQYHGRIDDNYQNPILVEHHELQDAINAVLDGRRPEQQLTPAIGCSIKWKV
jgi:peroxiredoxin